ncbi:hypothetical protein M3Y98_00848900 [Aphelenchoides besseyi]|nr:hypothetical protein M3Y98_00848900 [Aphelenchoides besseyi]KAI6195319.1 hypothetical protein M3Y96_01218300 [Aphelenchoides besseyi]
MLKVEKEIENGLPLISSTDRQQPSAYFGHRTRYLIVLLSWLCLSCVVGNSLTLNFTVICMRKEATTNEELTSDIVLFNSTTQEAEPFYTPTEQAFLFSSVAIGCLVGAFTISYFITIFGTRIVFTTYGLISGVSMFLMPIAIYTRIELVFFMRFLQGIGASTSFVMMGQIIASWAPYSSSGSYLAFISTHLQVSKLLVMPTAGLLCQSELLGWPVAFYVQSFMTVLLFICFFYFYRNSPATHKNVSQIELSLLQRDKVLIKSNSQMKQDKQGKVPYRSILTDVAVLGAVISLCGGNLSYQTFVFWIFAQFGPTYLNKVLRLNVQHTGFTSAVPALLCIVLKLLIGPLSERMSLSPRGRVILFASLSQFTMSFCFVVLAYLPEGNAFTGQLFFTLAYLFSGMNIAGVIASCQLISGPFVHFIMSLNSLSTSFVILLLPPAMSHFAPRNSREEWTKILVFIAVFCCTTTLIFDLTAQATPRPWVMNRNRRSCSTNCAKEENSKEHQINS